MTDRTNNRETGARHLPAKADADAHDGFAQDAATNRKPKGGFGLSEPADDVNEKTSHYDGQNPARQRTFTRNQKGLGVGQAWPSIRKTPKRPKADAKQVPT